MPPILALTIVVTGNIASGKSTLCKGLLAAMPELEYACMDRLRVELLKSGVEARSVDNRAAPMILAQMETLKPLLYESSGATQLFRRASSQIRGYRRGPIVRIRTTCNRTVAMHRFHARRAAGHKQMAPSFKGALPIEECWYRFEDMLRGERVDVVLDSGVMSAIDMLRAAMALIKEKIGEKKD